MPEPRKNPGYVPDVKTPTGGPDLRNHVAAVVPSIATSYMTDISMLPIWDQQQEPACVAYAIVKVMMYLIWKKTGNIIQLSPRFLYALCKANDGMPNTEGTSVLVALKLAQKYGVCEESYFPSDATLPLSTFQNSKLIPTAAFANAASYKIGEYLTLPNTDNATIESALEKYFMVLTGITINEAWWTSPAGVTSWAVADIDPLRPAVKGDPQNSDHLINIWGFDATYFDMVHDWSINWANHGTNRLTALDMPWIYETWVIVDVMYPAPTPAPVIPDATPAQTQQATGLLTQLINLLTQWVQQLGGTIASVFPKRPKK